MKLLKNLRIFFLNMMAPAKHAEPYELDSADVVLAMMHRQLNTATTIVPSNSSDELEAAHKRYVADLKARRAKEKESE